MPAHNFNSPTRTKTIASALSHTRQCIAGLTETPGLDAQVLLAFVSGKPKTWLLAHTEETLTPDQNLKLAQSLAEITAGVPLPYVIGQWEFFGRSFLVTPDVLIPRPETELLVEAALAWLSKNPGRCRVAEAGTGSGCIAVSVAAEFPVVAITAVDVSSRALAVAASNAERHYVGDQIDFIQNDLLAGLDGQYDLILANLPYIPGQTLRRLSIYGHEPTIALDGGRDGLDLIRRLLCQLPAFLLPGGAALLEIEAGQGDIIRDLARQTLPGDSVSVKQDLAGHPRLLIIQR